MFLPIPKNNTSNILEQYIFIYFISVVLIPQITQKGTRENTTVLNEPGVLQIPTLPKTSALKKSL